MVRSRADDPERQRADFQALYRRLLSFSTPSASCKSMDARQLKDEQLTKLSEPILVPASATSRQQLGLKLPVLSKLKPPQLIQHLGFKTEV